jgi:hypothetical protein
MSRMGYDDNTLICAKAVKMLGLLRDFTAHYKVPVKLRIDMAKQISYEGKFIERECGHVLSQQNRDHLDALLVEIEHHKHGEFHRYDKNNRQYWAKK